MDTVLTNQNILVSVIMSVYNEEKYVEKAIRSILNQTYKNIELIIVDDYSTDHSLEICQNLAGQDARIIVCSKKNEPRYLASSRNMAIKMAKGKYIVFQDADDTCLPERIEKQLNKALENNKKRIVGCSAKYLYKTHNDIKILPTDHNQIIKGFNSFSGRGNYIIMGTVLGPKEIFLKYPYREFLRYMQDWDQALRMYESNEVEFCNVSESLYNYNLIDTEYHVTKIGWLDCNLFIRISQSLRKKYNIDINSFQELEQYLKKHPLDNIYWKQIKLLLILKNKYKRAMKKI